MALYAELDDSTKALQRLSDLKSRFLSEMSHEFRSPLNSIKSLTGFLLARSDGDLIAEQEKQVQFIRQAAEGLSTLVDDLLDLAKVEAGKAVIRIALVRGRATCSMSLQGTIRPMIDHERVSPDLRGPERHPDLADRRGKGRADPAEFPHQRREIHRARGDPGRARSRGPDDVVIFSVKDTGHRDRGRGS